MKQASGANGDPLAEAREARRFAARAEDPRLRERLVGYAEELEAGWRQQLIGQREIPGPRFRC